jgi:hypothetical protein
VLDAAAPDAADRPHGAEVVQRAAVDEHQVGVDGAVSASIMTSVGISIRPAAAIWSAAVRSRGVWVTASTSAPSTTCPSRRI